MLFFTPSFFRFLYNQNTITHLFTESQLPRLHVYLSLITFFVISTNTFIYTLFIFPRLYNIYKLLYLQIYIFKRISYIIVSIFIWKYTHLSYRTYIYLFHLYSYLVSYLFSKWKTLIYIYTK